MKDETFCRFALCVSDRYNRVGFAILCDLDSKTLIFRNTRTRAMLERIAFVGGDADADIEIPHASAAARYQGKEFARAFRLVDDDVRMLAPMLRTRDYARFDQRCKNLAPGCGTGRIRYGESNLIVSFEGYVGTETAPLRIDDYHSRDLTLPPFDQLRHWLMDRFDLWMLPGANPTEKTSRRRRVEKRCG